jgi:transcriptional regulator with XRE-family HTH domain
LWGETVVTLNTNTFFLTMSFSIRLAALRKEFGFTQQQIADKIGMHLSPLKRYEAGASQPTIDVFRRIALALNISADVLLFETNERGPDDRLKLQFEALSHLDERWTPAASAAPAATPKAQKAAER